MPDKIQIYEVGPRDGLQNEKQVLPLDVKREFVQLLAKASPHSIEVTSFVRKDKIPQMADASELMESLKDHPDFSKFICLVPNEKGMEGALNASVSEIAIFTATSETFNKKNISVSIEESLERLRPVALRANQEGIRVRGYISTAFGCPYEGAINTDTLLKVTNRLLDFGVYQISFGDTIGIANPDQVQKMVDTMKGHFDLSQMAMHFHDTRGMGLANILASYQEGIRIFDSSAGGLGGCPYAKGATGNVATEDVVYMLQAMGLETGVDLVALKKAVDYIFSHLGTTPKSKNYYLI